MSLPIGLNFFFLLNCLLMTYFCGTAFLTWSLLELYFIKLCLCYMNESIWMLSNGFILLDIALSMMLSTP